MSSATQRLVELDLLRGLAVAGMILVVSPGDWGAAYAQLQHAEWNGWTLADMVFPTFLFSVGVAIALSFPRPWRTVADRRRFWIRVLRRAALLIVLGLALEASYNWELQYTGSPLGKPSLAYLRLPGILQRIALCYLLGAAAVLASAGHDSAGRRTVRPGAVAAIAIALLLGYWALLRFVPTPGFGPGRLDPDGYLGGYVDRAIFTVPHLWPLGWAHPGGPVVYDPEGLLSTLPATVNVLLGVITGWAWRRNVERAAMVTAAAGVVLIVAGLLIDPVFPINKRIWSSSFVLFSGGFSAVLLAALMLVSRWRGAAVVLAPFRVLGGNAILAFIVSTLLGRLYDLPIVASQGHWLAPRSWLDMQALRIVGDPHVAATACALLFVAVIVLLLAPLHWRAVHFRL
jgi:predicted acyltransferase